MCETGSEWEKSPRRKIIQIFFLLFQISFLLGRKTSQKKSLFYWYQKVFDLQCVETLPLRFEVLWLIRESLWETELVTQLGLIDDSAQLLSSTAWFSWDSRNFKVQHPKWEWKAPREELPAWGGVVGLVSEISFLNQNKSRIKLTSSNPASLHTELLSHRHPQVVSWRFWLWFFFFLWDKKRSKKTF